jgi:hypothetical protein
MKIGRGKGGLKLISDAHVMKGEHGKSGGKKKAGK